MTFTQLHSHSPLLTFAQSPGPVWALGMASSLSSDLPFKGKGCVWVSGLPEHLFQEPRVPDHSHLAIGPSPAPYNIILPGDHWGPRLSWAKSGEETKSRGESTGGQKP